MFVDIFQIMFVDVFQIMFVDVFQIMFADVFEFVTVIEGRRGLPKVTNKVL